ncbi:AI-2E family transporter [Periweissella fabalis]|uniref:AI-2E family transporter n=1 Tax=Periweissella fabalis TaxID=1070421 RepID=A0A7X6N4T9_9LACO|nr:AI-2E family transporter [Periweissella fabalis]MCM0599598.1 AI-2E family transporter [Periweissella fabalis]NKZ23903.1 AI-2E family transporter [Periweissella fabalis]
MFDKLRNSKLLFWSLELLVLVLIVFMCTRISFLFEPLGIFISTIFVPLILSGFCFYVLNPIVELVEKIHFKQHKLPHTVAVLIVMLAVLLLITGILMLVIPQLISQVSKLLANIPAFTNALQDQVNDFSHSRWIKHLDLNVSTKSLEGQVSKYTKGFLLGTANGIGTIVSMVTSITITAITVPVMVFYMLNDGHKFLPSIKKFFQPSKADAIEDLLKKMSKTISQYIDGQVIECLFVAVFTTIGYFIIGQPYALLLGIVAGIANIIPYVGPYLGIFPSLLVALTMGTWQIIWVIVIVIIVQQVDGNVIYPNIIGKTLKIHPLTIIIILLAAGNIAGIPGMILAIPFYAIVRTIVEFGWHLWLVQNNHASPNDFKDIEVEVLQPRSRK